jgi:hypothetical protein
VLFRSRAYRIWRLVGTLDWLDTLLPGGIFEVKFRVFGEALKF